MRTPACIVYSRKKTWICRSRGEVSQNSNPRRIIKKDNTTVVLYFHPGQEHMKLTIRLPPVLCLMDRLQITLAYPEKDGSFSEPSSICLDKTSEGYHSLVEGDPSKLQRISHLINFFVSGIRLAFSSDAGQTLEQQETSML